MSDNRRTLRSTDSMLRYEDEWAILLNPAVLTTKLRRVLFYAFLQSDLLNVATRQRSEHVNL